MMPAAKHGDMQMGVDIHLCMVPMPAPTPTPLPTPHMSVVFDPFDYVPVIGATITVCGMKRATAGTAGKVVHIPPGFPFAPKMPDTEDELFMGSSTVVADGDPMSHIAHPVLSCQAAGMMSPFRLKKKGGPRAMVLPTVFNLATPTTVFVGGPPTISMMGMAMKGVFAGLGKLAKSGVFKRMRQKLFKNMKPGFLKCTILRAEPVNILSGAVSVEQQDFSLPGRLPVDWVRAYSSSNSHVGVCGPGWETLLDIRLEVDAADGSVMLQGPGVGPLSFERLPAAAGDAEMVLELSDGARLTDHGDEWQVRTKEDRIYCFPKSMAMRTALGDGRAPIGRITDRCGNALTIEYRGREPHALIEAAGRRLALTMVNGRLVAVTLIDDATRTEHGFVRYEYDAAGDLVAAIDALGAPYRFDYGSGVTAHHMVRHTDRNGLSFHYTYETAPDGTQRVVHSWGDGGLYDYRFDYLDALNERRITDSLGHVSLVKLDDRGLPINEIDPLGGMTVYEYDDAGRTTAVVDPAGRRIGYSYDISGNLIVLTRPDSSSLHVTHDHDDKPTAVQEPGGGVWRQRWDPRGLLIARRSPAGRVQRFEYDSHGQLVAAIDTKGGVSRFAYDAWGGLVSMTDTLGREHRFVRDALGRLRSKTDPLGRSTVYEFDAKGRLRSMTLTTGHGIRFDYDGQDRLTQYIDPAGAATRLAYDGRLELTRRQMADGSTITYHYDAEERLVEVQDATGGRYLLRRDAIGRVVEEIDATGRSRRYAWDGSGHLVRMDDAMGRSIEYATDPFGRIVGKRAVDPRRPGWADMESYAYDIDGRLVEAVNADASLRRTYDLDGLLTGELQRHADGAAFEIEFVLDEAGRRVERHLRFEGASTQTIRHAYDSAGQEAQVTIGEEPPVQFVRDASGRLLEQRQTGGVRLRWQYGSGTLPVALSADTEGRMLATTRYGYDACERLLAREDHAFGVDRFAYDPVGRLTMHADPAGHVAQYLHDQAGRRFGTARQETESGYGFELAGQQFGFDKAGHLTTRHDGRECLTLAWDVHQRLRASRRAGSPHDTRYGYDPLGRRVFKETGGRYTRFGWDGDTMVGESCEGEQRYYLYRADGFVPFAWLQERGGQTQTCHYQTDPNGWPVRLFDRDGTQRWANAGLPVSAAGHANAAVRIQPLRGQGQYYDDETGLCYSRHRYFDPTLARFVSPDPITLRGGTDLYAHGRDPLNWIDPLGLSGIPCGFSSFGQFQQFGQATQAGMARSGYPGTTAYMQGSAVTGVSHDTGIPFDVGRKSDFDVALAGEDIFRKAEDLGLAKGTRTGPIKMGSEEAKALGIDDTLSKLSRMSGGREVNVMVFKDADAVKAKGPSLRIPAKCH